MNEDAERPPPEPPVGGLRGRLRAATAWLNDGATFLKAVGACIVAAVAIAAAVGLTGDGENKVPASSPAPTASATPRAQRCTITGVVRDRDTGKTTASVDVGWVPAGTHYDEPESLEIQATSGPRGKFSFDCPPDKARREFALLRDAWGGCLAITQVQVPASSGAHERTLTFSGNQMRQIAFQEGDSVNPCGG